MARKPASGSRGKSKAAPAKLPAPISGTSRDKIIAALLALLGEKPIEQIGLAEIASEAGVSLADMRGEFGSVLSIYAAHVKAIDRALLAEDLSDMADEPPRERLFDVLMRRLELMTPYQEAVRSILRSAMRNPPLALALNRIAVRSQQWMLTAADIDSSGPRGMVRAQGLALLFSSVLRTWTNDGEPGLARTMAALDRALARGQRFAGFLDDLSALPSRLARFRTRRRRPRDDEDDETATA